MPWTTDDVVRLLLNHGGVLQRHGAKHDIYRLPGASRPV